MENKDDVKKARFTVIVSDVHQKRLAEIAKIGKVSQGDVIEIMIDMADEQAIIPQMEKIREAKKKTDGRASNSAMAKKINSLSPEQRKLIEDMFAVNGDKQ